MLKRGIQSILQGRQAPMALRCFAGNTKLAKFDYLDPLVIEDQFTEEEKMVRDSARAYA